MKKTLSSTHRVSFPIFHRSPFKIVWNIHCEELHFSSCFITILSLKTESFEKLSSMEKTAR